MIEKRRKILFFEIYIITIETVISKSSTIICNFTIFAPHQTSYVTLQKDNYSAIILTKCLYNQRKNIISYHTMKTAHAIKAKDLLTEGYAALRVVQLLKEDGMLEEEAVILVDSITAGIDKKYKKNKLSLVWHAIFAGFVVMILGSLLWAGVAYQTGNDSIIINVVIGAVIGFVMRSVSQDIPRKIIPIMAVLFAMFSIFLGDIIFQMIYWHEEFVMAAGNTPFFQYMIMTGFWDASWEIITHRNVMDIIWMSLSGVIAYFFAK